MSTNFPYHTNALQIIFQVPVIVEIQELTEGQIYCPTFEIRIALTYSDLSVNELETAQRTVKDNAHELSHLVGIMVLQYHLLLGHKISPVSYGL